MISEIKRWRLTCDRCRTTVVFIDSTYQPQPPKTWQQVDVHDCGSTGYTRTDAICPSCAKKTKVKRTAAGLSEPKDK